MTAPAPAAAIPGRRLTLNTLLVEARALIALIIIFALFSALTSNYYQGGNIELMVKHVASNVILALGMLVVILNGGIDLSVGSTVGLCGVVAGYLLQLGWKVPGTQTTAYPSVWVVCVIALALGAFVGWVNGVIISRLNVAPFIATLGMLYVARGVALLITDGDTYTQIQGDPTLGNTGFVSHLASQPLGLPLPIWVMVAFAIVFSLLLTRTAFGRWLYATGSNSRAAELSGVPVKRVQTRIYVLSGICAGAVGLLLTADLPGATGNAGNQYELNAIAAVVIGGAALSGGRGTVRGTVIGGLFIGFLVDGLVLNGVNDFWQQVVKGAVIVIVIAVAIDQVQQMLEKRRAVRKAYVPTPRASGGGGAASAREGDQAVAVKS